MARTSASKTPLFGCVCDIIASALTQEVCESLSEHILEEFHAVDDFADVHGALVHEVRSAARISDLDGPLDLSRRTNAGDIGVATGFHPEYELAGEVTTYGDFTIRELP